MFKDYFEFSNGMSMRKTFGIRKTQRQKLYREHKDLFDPQ